MIRTLALLSALLIQDPPADYCSDDEAKTHLAECKKELGKAKTPDDAVAAIEAYGTKKHPKILAELTALLGRGTEDTRIAAAEQISKYVKEPKASDALLNGAKQASSRKELAKLTIKCLRYVGTVGVRAHTKQLVVYFNHREPDIAVEAVNACGDLKGKDAIQPLVNTLRELEAIREDDKDQDVPPGGGGIPGGPGGAPAQEDDKLKRKKALVGPVNAALRDITGEKFNTAKEWGAWVSKNLSSFKEAEEPDPKKEEKK